MNTLMLCRKKIAGYAENNMEQYRSKYNVWASGRVFKADGEDLLFCYNRLKCEFRNSD
jgi:hypothetical protein